VGRISGEVFADHDFSGIQKISIFLSLLASINMVLFLFNLLPIYPLRRARRRRALREGHGRRV